MLPLVSLVLALTPQPTQSSPDVEIPGCSITHCKGKRVAHRLGMLRFCVPPGMKYRRAAGFEGDIHDTITVHSRKDELVIFTANSTWGPVKARPEWYRSSSAQPEGSVRRWRCSEGDGSDFRLTHNGRSWRMLAFPAGFAGYEDVSEDIAGKFDRVLDSLCCEPLG